MENEPSVAPEPTRRARKIDIVLGIVGGVLVLGALAMLFTGGSSDTSAPAGPPPAISIIEPASGDTVSGVLQVVFTTAGDLQRTPDGWGEMDLGLHLHLRVDRGAFMPAGPDLTKLPDGNFRWTFGQLEPGPHTIQVFWADASHNPEPNGGSETVNIQVTK